MVKDRLDYPYFLPGPSAPAMRGGTPAVPVTIARRVLREVMRGFAVAGCLHYPTAEGMDLARRLTTPGDAP